MLITARDIVRRLPEADDNRIRLELAGNLCRCTGYDGIVRAISRVLDERLPIDRPAAVPIPTAQFSAAAIASPVNAAGNTDGLNQRLSFAFPAATLWQALHDPAFIAGCIPGATIRSSEAGHLTGDLIVALGPIRIRFEGSAELTFDETQKSGTLHGNGSDRTSGTRVSGEAAFRVTGDATASMLTIEIGYALKGPLSHLAKGQVIDSVAGVLAAAFAATLAARLRGEVTPAASTLSAAHLALQLLRAWFAKLKS